MNFPYQFNPRLVLRHPALPLPAGEGALPVADPEFREAIYLASPVLYRELEKWEAGQLTDPRSQAKLQRSLAKYHRRMSSRCTPFGLFSGCSTATWSHHTWLEAGAAPVHRQTRLDMHYLCALSQELAALPFLAPCLRYHTNTSLYRLGDELRYVEYRYQQGRRLHNIASVAVFPELTNILDAAAAGLPFDDLVAHLLGPDVSEDEARGFVRELIDEQLLVSELEPAITTPDHLGYLRQVLWGLPVTEPLSALLALLDEVAAGLEALDRRGTNDPAAYRRLADQLRQLPVPLDESKLFQTDCFFPSESHCLDRAWQAELRSSLLLLARLSPAAGSTNLASFARRFSERYEEREVPLLEALDVESGIGYLESAGNDILPLVQDLHLPPRRGERTASLGMREQFLLRQLARWNPETTNVLRLSEADLGEPEPVALPPSLSVLFRLLDGDRILLESAGGSSAANLLGRFAHGSGEIRELIDEVTRSEEALDPDVLFAEIVHLPESRVGNILLHPPFRTYEIPFLARSSVPRSHQLTLDDLLVSVRNGQVFLRSRRLNRQVVPRLSSAHNFSGVALPVYQFLCELQTQGLRPGLGFHWGQLEAFYERLPRVEYGRTVLAPAQWQLSRQQLDSLLPEATRPEALEALRRTCCLPARLVLADGDNELLINLDQPESVAIWLETVRQRSRCTLKEFLDEEGQGPFRDISGRVYANQFVALLQKTERTYPQPDLSAPSPSVRRSFAPGSEWVYLKIYCGPKSADRILREGVAPLVKGLEAAGRIRAYFFIRYKDPGFHLRLRLHLTDAAAFSPLMAEVHRVLASGQLNSLIARIQLDTYQRELERYGGNSMEWIEALFCADSRSVLGLLQSDTASLEPDRWLWTLQSIDRLLQLFGFDTAGKLRMLTRLKDAFHREFAADAALLERLTGRYRQYRSAIEAWLSAKGREDALLRERDARSAGAVAALQEMDAGGRLEVALEHLLGSLIHMTVNRVVSSEARTYELVLYDLLFTYYRSALARARQSSIPKNAGV